MYPITINTVSASEAVAAAAAAAAAEKTRAKDRASECVRSASRAP